MHILPRQGESPALAALSLAFRAFHGPASPVWGPRAPAAPRTQPPGISSRIEDWGSGRWPSDSFRTRCSATSSSQGLPTWLCCELDLGATVSKGHLISKGGSQSFLGTEVCRRLAQGNSEQCGLRGRSRSLQGAAWSSSSPKLGLCVSLRENVIHRNSVSGRAEEASQLWGSLVTCRFPGKPQGATQMLL